MYWPTPGAHSSPPSPTMAALASPKPKSGGPPLEPPTETPPFDEPPAPELPEVDPPVAPELLVYVPNPARLDPHPTPPPISTKISPQPPNRGEVESGAKSMRAHYDRASQRANARPRGDRDRS